MSIICLFISFWGGRGSVRWWLPNLPRLPITHVMTITWGRFLGRSLHVLASTAAGRCQSVGVALTWRRRRQALWCDLLFCWCVLVGGCVRGWRLSFWSRQAFCVRRRAKINGCAWSSLEKISIHKFISELPKISMDIHRHPTNVDRYPWIFPKIDIHWRPLTSTLKGISLFSAN